MRRLARMIVAAATATVARLVPAARQAGGAPTIALYPSSIYHGTIDLGPWFIGGLDPAATLNKGEVS